MPWRRTSTFSAALFPTGTLACGRFGIASRPRFRRCSTESSSTLLTLISWARWRLASWIFRAVEPLAPCARHLVARRVLFAFQPLELGQQPAAPRFEHDQLVELGAQIEPAVLKPGADGIGLVPEKRWIKHGESAACH